MLKLPALRPINIEERRQKRHSLPVMYWTEPRNIRELLARNPIVVSFAISLLVHGLLFGGWRMGKSLGWWDHQATWLLNLTKKMQAIRARPPVAQPPPQQEFREIPLSFMEVDPALLAP